MIKKLLKVLITFLLPIIVIIILIRINVLIGLVALIVYIAISVYSSRSAIYTALGSSNYSKGNIGKALTLFEKAYHTGKMPNTTIAFYAYILLKTGNIELSENLLTKMLKTNLSLDDINQFKSIFALVHWKRQRLDEAIEMLEEVIKNYSTTSVYGSLGYFYILKGDLEKALTFNLEAYDYNNSDNIINDNLGQTYLALEQYEKSKEIYEILISKKPTFPEAYFNYGLLLEALEQHDQAQEMFKVALESKFSYLSSLTKEQIQTKLD